MKVCVIILLPCYLVCGLRYNRVFSDTRAVASSSQQHFNARHKREAVGALDIVTNNAQPIHAEVKPENAEVAGKVSGFRAASSPEEGVMTPSSPVKPGQKKCSKTYRNYEPSKIEPGVVFQVTPPKPGLYDVKSLRKSLPLTTKLDLIRGINRLVTLSVLAASAVFEFYPIIRQACDTIIDILNNT